MTTTKELLKNADMFIRAEHQGSNEARARIATNLVHALVSRLEATRELLERFTNCPDSCSTAPDCIHQVAKELSQ